MVPNKNKNGREILIKCCQVFLANAANPLLWFSENLVESQADRYKMAVIFKNSEGCKLIPKKLIQRRAPQWVVPKMGKKTIIKRTTLSASSGSDIFFKKCSGILKAISAMTSPMPMAINWWKM